SHVSRPLQALPSSQESGVPAWQPVFGSQVSTPLQALPSSQTTGLPTQVPFWQVSPLVQRLLSEHEPPCGTGDEQVPVLGWQVPGPLQWLPSLQTTGLPTQVPFWQVSPVVQRLPSEPEPPCCTGGEQVPVLG